MASAPKTEPEHSVRDILNALQAFLPQDQVRTTLCDCPPAHAALMRLAHLLVIEAEKRFLTTERSCSSVLDANFASPSAPASTLLGRRFRRLEAYFEDFSVGDIAQVPPDTIAACAKPEDSLLMRAFVHYTQDLLAGVAARMGYGTWTRPPPSPSAVASGVRPLEAGDTTNLHDAAPLELDLRRRFIGSDMVACTSSSVRYSRAGLVDRIQAMPCGTQRLRVLLLSNSLLCSADLADIADFVSTGALPQLRVLALCSCRRLDESCCDTIVYLLQSQPQLRVDLTFCSEVVSERTRDKLVNKLSLQELCRLIWIPPEWITRVSMYDAESDDEDESPSWMRMFDGAALSTWRDILQSRIEDAHQEHFHACTYNV